MGKGMLESQFQAKLVKQLKERYPGSIVFKGPSDQIQGFPDLIILHGPRWAALECKRSATSKHQPNQDYYVEKMNKMSFAAFIFPENKKEVLDGLQSTLEPRRVSRVSRRK